MISVIGFSKPHRKSADVLNRQSEYSATGSVARHAGYKLLHKNNYY